MILYTPLASTDIFPHEEKDLANRQCISYEGKSMYVEQNKEGSYQLLQLLSTDPNDFLDARYTPGTIISQANNESY
ncbi:MAG TPA: YlzJ-like family protein [Bacillota bacterium]|nr:YlzJ-like family protein [Bacillota bacterium]